MTRTFEDRPAVRERVPLLLGLIGPSGGGKTYSALRLATGIQTVSGGDVFLIDTEARRGLHYANDFKFRHVAFGAPFSPLDYLAAIEHCVSKGAGVVIVDSMSHEHEGPGGVLEMHEAETKRLAGAWKTSEDAVKMSAWGVPKRHRRRMINTILQLPCNFIFCFRAKQKLKVIKGKAPKAMGWMPIAGEEFVYEMAVNCLLLPNANGVPTLQSNEDGERMMIKTPGWASPILGSQKSLDEAMGASLAKWAAGTVQRSALDLFADYAACSDPATLGTLETERAALWRTLSTEEKSRLKAASEAAAKRLRDAEDTKAPIDDFDPTTGEVSDANENAAQ
jgi:hypothetical protein